jgi:hypothetical protein
MNNRAHEPRACCIYYCSLDLGVLGNVRVQATSLGPLPLAILTFFFAVVVREGCGVCDANPPRWTLGQCLFQSCVRVPFSSPGRCSGLCALPGTLAEAAAPPLRGRHARTPADALRAWAGKGQWLFPGPVIRGPYHRVAVDQDLVVGPMDAPAAGHGGRQPQGLQARPDMLVDIVCTRGMP